MRKDIKGVKVHNTVLSHWEILLRTWNNLVKHY
jgi:hypothetical protein